MDSIIPAVVTGVGLLSPLAAAVGLGWRFLTFLHMEVHVGPVERGYVKVRTVVANKTMRAQNFVALFLVVGPAKESALTTVNAIRAKMQKPPFGSGPLNDMVTGVAQEFVEEGTQPIEKVGADGRSIVPLPFYWIENVDVADEQLTYEHIIDARKLPDGVYSVRLYMERGGGKLYRVVHGAFHKTVEKA